jgi:hypothetical protein
MRINFTKMKKLILMKSYKRLRNVRNVLRGQRMGLEWQIVRKIVLKWLSIEILTM